MDHFATDFSPQDLTLLYQSTAALLPAEAVSALEKEPPGDRRSRALLGTVTGLATANLREALELLHRWPDEVTGGMLDSMARRTPAKDAAAMLEEAARFGDARAALDPMRKLLTTWSKTDPQAVRQWLQDHPQTPKQLKAEFGGQ